MKRNVAYWNADRVFGHPPKNGVITRTYRLQRTQGYSLLAGGYAFDPNLDIILQGGPKGLFDSYDSWWHEAKKDGRLVIKISADTIEFIGYEVRLGPAAQL